MCNYTVADYHHYLLLCSLSGIRSVLFTSGSSVCICIQLAGFKVHVLPLTVTLKSPSGYICMTLPTFPKICRNKNNYNKYLAILRYKNGHNSSKNCRKIVIIELHLDIHNFIGYTYMPYLASI